MSWYRLKIRLLTLAMVLATVTIGQGCRRGPALARVNGLVQHEGTPLTGGRVVFTSVERNRPAVGQIQSDGSFELTTIRRGDGAMPGQYRVTVVTDVMIRDKETHVTCIGPRNFLLQVEAGQENQFVINVSRSDGWQQALDD